MAKKTLIEISTDDEVTAGSTEITVATGVVPNGKVARVKRFGGTTPRDADGIESLTLLQWGSGGSWQTIRAFATSFEDIQLDREFVGNGAKTFRLVRVNRSTTDKPMIAWLEGLIITP